MPIASGGSAGPCRLTGSDGQGFSLLLAPTFGVDAQADPQQLREQDAEAFSGLTENDSASRASLLSALGWNWLTE